VRDEGREASADNLFELTELEGRPPELDACGFVFFSLGNKNNATHLRKLRRRSRMGEENFWRRDQTSANFTEYLCLGWGCFGSKERVSRLKKPEEEFVQRIVF
jgi:hypothetical protein